MNNIPCSKMPKIETIRKHFPDCKLSDDSLLEITEWLRANQGLQHVGVTNKKLKVLIDWEGRKKENGVRNE